MFPKGDKAYCEDAMMWHIINYFIFYFLQADQLTEEQIAGKTSLR